MSDQLVTTSPLPGQGDTLEGGQATAQTPQYVTLEEARKIANEASEAALRKAQSYVDKGVQKKLTQLDDQLKAWRNDGATITPEMEAQMKQGIIENAAQPVAQSPAQAMQPPAAPDPYTADAWKLMKDAGITIEEGDPEFSQIDQTSGYNFVKSIERLIGEKKQRLAREGQPPQAVVPGVTNGGIAAPNNLNKSNDELFQEWMGSRKRR